MDSNDTCQKGQTHNKQILMLCMDKDCQRKRLSCISCVDQLHCKHQIISINKFKKYIHQTLNHNCLLSNKDQIMGMVSEVKQNFKASIQTLKSIFINKMDTLLGEADKHISQIQKSFLSGEVINIEQIQFKDLSEDKVQQYLKRAHLMQKNLAGSIDEISKQISNLDKSMKERSTIFTKQMQSQIKSFSQIINKFKITSKNLDNLPAQFHAQNKAQCLTLTPCLTSVTRSEGSGGYPIALLAHPFTPQKPIAKFTITQSPGNKGIWMGVCVLDIVKSFNYLSCFGIGKGTWAIDQVGANHNNAWSWSHHDPAYSSAPKVGWQFSIGDIISIRVDYLKSTAVFSKNGLQQYEQPIRLDLGQIYGFAGPTNIHDVIKIA